MRIDKTTISFTASTDSAAIGGGLIFALQIPASFGVSSLTMLYCDTASGTFIPIKDEGGNNIGISGMDSSAAALYDTSNIFPMGVMKIGNSASAYIKFRSPSSITKDIIVFRGGE